jgi:hypothetical protein
MLNWILIRTSRILDWVLVILVVYALVYICQFMINFFTAPDDRDND